MYELMNKLIKYHFTFSRLVILSIIAIIFYNCNPGIEESPEPGVLRINLQSSNEDTSLVIAGETLTVKQYYWFSFIVDSTVDLSYIADGDTFTYTIDSIAIGIVSDYVTFLIDDHSLSIANDLLVISGSVINTSLILMDEEEEIFVISGDTIKVSKNYDMSSFKVSIFQGKAYHDSLYAILFTGLSKYRTESRNYNLLEQDRGQYKQFTIFESYVPPGDYDVLEFGLTASQLTLGVFNSPIELPEGENPLIRLSKDFEVFEGGTTELNLQIRPLESIARYRDSFIFDRIIEINTINYY